MTTLPSPTASTVSSFSSASTASAAALVAAAQARPANLVALLEDSVRLHGASELFVEKRNGRWTPLTYAGLGRQVDELRAGLAQLGVSRGDRVGIISGNRSEWAVAAYATYSLGAALVPMYETQKAKDWTFIARDAAVSVLFVSTPAIAAQMVAAAAELPALRALVLLDGPIPTGARTSLRHESFGSLRDLGAGLPLAALHPAPADTACLMYTSGTTGDPKGVILSHDNVVSNVVGLRSVIPLEREHRTLSFLPWAHALGHTVELHMLIACGASTGIAESVEQLAANFGEVRPTVLVAVPRVFQKIYAGVEKLMASKPAPLRWLYRNGLQAAVARSRGQRLGVGQKLLLALCDRLVFTKIRARFGGRLQFAVSGAAALAREVAEFVEALGIAVYEGYGLTETSPVVSANVPGCKRLGSVGRPLPGVRVVIDQSASSDQGDGEIVVYGPNVMVGYHNHPQETLAMMTSDGGLRTGDLGYLDADGFLFITGRIKELYKLENGKYVAPVPLEERLKLSPLVANVMIHGANRPCNVALVVPDLAAGRAALGDAAADLPALAASQALHTRLRAEIERLSAGWKGYEKVRAFAVLSEDFTQEAGFLTPSLKLKRRAVLARFGDRLEQLYREVGADGDD
jgi:long-chain acyl-CoA synthetase